jgi:hypothetical protein
MRRAGLELSTFLELHTPAGGHDSRVLAVLLDHVSHSPPFLPRLDQQRLGVVTKAVDEQDRHPARARFAVGE